MGGDHINKKIINSILIILILFFFVSFLGAASAANDISINDTELSTSGGGSLSVPMSD